MGARKTVRRILFGHDVAVAYAVILALYVVSGIRVQVLQIPAYLLIATYDLVEVVLPFLTPYHVVGFPVFLYLVAVVGAGMTRWFRSGPQHESVDLRAVGGVCMVVGVLSILFGGLIGGPVVAPTDNPTPLAITGLTGIVFFSTGWWLLRRLSQRRDSPVSSDP